MTPEPLRRRARPRRRVWLVALLLCLMPVPPADAATVASDILTSARESANAGRRPEALAALEIHLTAAPGDVDARLLYGLILSWEGRYLEARHELQQVLDQAPGYTDARVALMNVAWWSEDTAAAREVAEVILAEDAGNQTARHIRDQLDAAGRPWWVGITYANDAFSDDRSVWHEVAASVTRLTPHGSVILRATEARRFNLDDRLIEVEFYPRVRPGTYAFIGVGVAGDATFYPSHRVAFDFYQSVGAGFEVSGGFRRLGFDNPASIYVGTASKYLGNWMFTGKVFHVAGEGPLDSTSYHGGFRRYVRGDGVSYVGLTYSHGFSREEIRNTADLTTLGSDTVRAEIEQQFVRRVRLFVTGGASQQARQFRARLWQISASAGFSVLF